MNNDEPKKEEKSEEIHLDSLANPDMNTTSVVSSNEKEEENENDGGKDNRKQEVIINVKEEKPKKKKDDNTIEELKSKPPEEIQKEMKEDFKSHKIRYKTLSIIVSATLFLFLFGLAVAVSYYKNASPPESNYVPEAKIELPTDMPEKELDTSDWKTSEGEQNDSWTKHTNIENGVSIELPPDWSIVGTVIHDDSDNKIGEFSPGHINTNDASVDCPEFFRRIREGGEDLGGVTFEFTLETYGKFISEDTVTVEDIMWELFISEVGVEPNNESVITGWYPHDYCTEREGGLFSITFYSLVSPTTNLEEFEKILATVEFLDQDVQGLSTSSDSCLNDNQKVLSEVNQCEELTEESCLEYVDQFNYCMKSCLNIVDEEQCTDICRPVCETETSDEI